MILIAAFSLVALAEPAPSTWVVADDEFDKRLDAAGRDVGQLWELVRWCDDTGREKEVQRALKAILKVQPDHRGAHERLGHLEFEGEWFTSEKELERHKKKIAAERAKELGYVNYRGDWVPPADVPYLEKGLVRAENGRWMTSEEVERLAAGWRQQDLVWVSPDEVSKISEGLWKCGDDWLGPEEADRYHSRLEQPWVIPTETLTLWTNLDRATAEKAIQEMERAYRVLAKLYGSTPGRPLRVLLARRSEQLVRFLQGGEAGPALDSRRLMESLRSTFADAWFDPEQKAWTGAGASFWDTQAEGGDGFGVHDARMALGLAFAEAMDPSPKAVAKLEKKGRPEAFTDEFWAEKADPAWWFWGTACYASRYFEDLVERGGDPWWARKWSVENLKRDGGLPFLRTVWELEVRWDDRDSGRGVNASGLVVAFIFDGGCAPLVELNDELRAAIREGQDTAKIFERLRMAVEEHETELRAFAGL